MKEKRKLNFFVAAMICGCLVVDGTTVTLLYRSALAEQRSRLLESVRQRSRLIEAVARFDAEHSDRDHPHGAQGATLSQVLDAHSRSRGFGDTGEFTLGRLKKDAIEFLVPPRHGFPSEDRTLPFDGALAQPMIYALRGESGWMIGRDYRGARVLAAYEPVAEIGWGLVAKIDLAEIRRPYIRAALIGIVVAIGVMLLIFRVLFRFAKPLIHRVEESEAATQAILDTAVEGILTINDRGIVQSFNTAAERIFGYTGAEILGKNIKMLMPEPDHGRHDGYLRAYLETGQRKIIGIGREVNGRRKDGSIFPLDLAVSEVVVDGKRTFTGIVRDISDRKAAEEELNQTLLALKKANSKLAEEQTLRIQTEKLSSIGLLASGVAHEINNPLSGVMACLKSLEAGTVPPEKREEYFGTARDGLERIQTTVKSLLDYARQRPPEESPCDLREVIEGSVRLLAPAIRKKSIEVVSDGLTPQVVIADRAQLMQAVTNVLLNAVHAAPPGTAVSVRILHRDPQIGIRIADEGDGIPDEIQKKVCDPFFTTKAEGEGTGLGLSVTQGILHSHHGELEIQSQPQQGTTVTLWLPKTTETKNAARAVG